MSLLVTSNYREQLMPKPAVNVDRDRRLEELVATAKSSAALGRVFATYAAVAAQVPAPVMINTGRAHFSTSSNG